MEITYRPIDIWSGELRAEHRRKGPPFRATWTDTLRVLDRELGMLKAKRIVAQLALRESDLRLDGTVRANARPSHPGVILAFDSMYGPLKYATDVFTDGSVWTSGKQDWHGYKPGGSKHVPGWQSNVRAIALGLEALRKVDRYGITKRGEQYQGWKALPPGIPMLGAMGVDEAAKVLAAYMPGADGGDLVVDVDGAIDLDTVETAWKAAAKATHPDAGGDLEEFAQAKRAYDVLKAAA